MEAALVAIDSDVIVDYLRRGRGVLDTALDQYSCVFTAITIYELFAVHSPARQQALLQQLMPRVATVPLDAVAAQRASGIWRALAERGELIGLPDILTAGICLQHDLPLLTRNTVHFGRVAGLKVLSPDDLQARFGG
jgi:predicted nucleic acid-binding protein